MSDSEPTYVPPRPGDVAVVICAYTEERWDDIVVSVQSVIDQIQGPAEIALVIDHNPSLLNRARDRFSDPVQVLENRHLQGLSGARNSGIEATKAPIVAFLDDDARARPDWLSEMMRAYENPDVVGAGGYIAPDWESSSPRWWPAEFNWVVGCSYIGLPTERSQIRNPIGANMSIRRSTFEGVGGFNSSLGRVGKNPAGAEETEMFIRIANRVPGAQVIFEPSASVDHRVGAERSNFKYFRRRCYADGISKGLTAHIGKDSGNLSSEWGYTLKTLPLGFSKALVDGAKGSAGGFGRAGAIVAGLLFTTAGYLRGRTLDRAAPDVPETSGSTERS